MYDQIYHGWNYNCFLSASFVNLITVQDEFHGDKTLIFSLIVIILFYHKNVDVSYDLMPWNSWHFPLEWSNYIVYSVTCSKCNATTAPARWTVIFFFLSSFSRLTHIVAAGSPAQLVHLAARSHILSANKCMPPWTLSLILECRQWRGERQGIRQEMHVPNKKWLTNKQTSRQGETIGCCYICGLLLFWSYVDDQRRPAGDEVWWGERDHTPRWATGHRSKKAQK